MRTFRYARRPAAAAALAGAALLGGTAACGSPATSAGSNAPATSTAATGTSAAPETGRASTPGNALSGLTADQIATRASADLRTASSFRITGSATDAGQKITMNLSVGRKGCAGTLGIKGQGSFTLLMIGKKLWIKPDDKFWKYAAGSAGTAVLSLVSGKYIEPGSKGSSLGAMAAFCSPNQFAGSFGSHPAGLVKGVTTTISGQRALQIKDTADAASVYVSISARPEFLRLDGGGNHGHLDFSHYNEPLHLLPPPASETLDGARYGF